LQDDVLGGVALNYYDYGARFYDQQLGIFHNQDRFAEKYKKWSPYSYCHDNPLKFIDINGDSLSVNDQSKNNTASQKFNDLNSKGTGGFYKTTIDPKTGKVTLASTGQKGSMNKEQTAFYKALDRVVNVDSKMTSINIVDGDKKVQIADVKTQTIDVGDIQKLGEHSAMSSFGALAHEITEQRILQSNFNGNYNDANIFSAHNYGMMVEDQVNGSQRSRDNAGVGVNTVRNGTGSYLINYQQNGQNTQYGIDMVDNNVFNVEEICP
jgi:RHS repeat-associated protein